MATATLADLDEQMAAHIGRIGPCTLRPRSGRRSHFEQLARSITFQQLAGRAAATIWNRVRALVEGRFLPSAVMALSDEQLRGAGLSTNKLLSIRDLAARAEDGRLRLGRIARKSDEAIVEELVTVRGIGRWTAEMFLIFQLCRLDVWPSSDLGVRNGYRILYELPELPTVKTLDEMGARFAPYRSIAAWYCWRAADVMAPGDTPRSSSPR